MMAALSSLGIHLVRMDPGSEFTASAIFRQGGVHVAKIEPLNYALLRRPGPAAGIAPAAAWPDMFLDLAMY